MTGQQPRLPSDPEDRAAYVAELERQFAGADLKRLVRTVERELHSAALDVQILASKVTRAIDRHLDTAGFCSMPCPKCTSCDGIIVGAHAPHRGTRPLGVQRRRRCLAREYEFSSHEEVLVDLPEGTEQI